jgi:hypothetical protein
LELKPEGEIGSGRHLTSPFRSALATTQLHDSPRVPFHDPALDEPPQVTVRLQP